MKIRDILTNNFIYIFIFLLFLSTLIYNYFYFLAIGINNFSIPISMIDYINNMEWYWIIPLILYFIYIEIPLKKIENFQTEEELIKHSPNPEKTKKIRSFPFKMLCFISIIGIIIFIIKKIFNLNIILNEEEVPTLLLIINFCLFDWILRDKNLSKNIIIIIFVAMILTSIGIVGYFNGINTKYKKVKEILVLKNNKKIHCTILRNFNDVLLVKDINSYMFIFKENIRIIRYLK